MWRITEKNIKQIFGEKGQVVQMIFKHCFNYLYINHNIERMKMIWVSLGFLQNYILVSGGGFFWSNQIRFTFIPHV